MRAKHLFTNIYSTLSPLTLA
ncbi:hypothetical protein PSP6_980008 [Paraburkholderia tropica]|nr:hypothetical protein PSP6_980008 [Paraburkholderia tropica]